VSFLIGITGKGGVGKTTIAALIVRRLVAAGRLPVLAVDADPNSCLDLALGMPVTSSVGSIREEARILAGKGLVAGISKQELLQLKISESLVEEIGRASCRERVLSCV
jgi:CO dehydrogenase maturation factor